MSTRPGVGGNGQILVTAFKPWLGRRTNRSEEIHVLLQKDRGSDGRFSFPQPLAVDFFDPGKGIKTELKRHDPSGVLMMGEKNGSSPALVVETTARKYLLLAKASPYADIEFLQLKRMTGDIKESGLSFAGPCNAVYRSALDWWPNDGRPIIFVHLPREYPILDKQKRIVSRILDDMLEVIGTGTGR